MSINGLFPMDKWDFKNGDLLENLPSSDLEILMKDRSDQLYKKGEVIFREGTYPSGIFLIVEGFVKKYKQDKAGKEQIIYIAKTGELLGYRSVLAEERYPDSAAALQHSKIAFIPKDDFLKAVSSSPELTQRLLKVLSHEVAVLTNSLGINLQKPVRERLALQLVVLREKSKVDFQPGDMVEIDISREDLASIVGTAKENVVRVLSDFKEENILHTNGRKIVIENVHELIRIANHP